MGSLHDSVRDAFGASEWHANAHAFLQACGLSLFVMDLEVPEPLFAKDRCGYCHLALDSLEPGPTECYDRLPPSRDTVSQHECRAGLTTYVAPVVHEGSIVCHAVVSGFVSSTRERRRLYERLIGRGIREEVARLAVRSMPVFTRREIEAFAQLAASIAQSAVVACVASHERQISAAARERDLGRGEVSESTLSAVEAALAILDDPIQTSRRLLLSALEIFEGEAGTIALSRAGGYVELIASEGADVRPRGTKLRLDGGAAARALESGKIVVVRGERAPGRPGRPVTVVAPLMRGDSPSGTLEVRLLPGSVPDAIEARRIERFARFASLAIAHSERYAAASLALSASERVNALACALDRLTDRGDIVEAVLEELARSLAFDVAGVVLTGWGHDRADIVLGGAATAAEVEMLIGEAAGRDVSADPLEDLRHVERGGSLLEGGDVREHWAFVCVPIACANHDGGHLFSASASGGHYSRADNRLLEGIAQHLAAAIERAEVFSRMRSDVVQASGHEQADRGFDSSLLSDIIDGPDERAEVVSLDEAAARGDRRASGRPA